MITCGRYSFKIALTSAMLLLVPHAGPTAASDPDGAIKLPQLKIINAERVAALPEPDRAAWQAYLERSRADSVAERKVLAAELAAEGLSESRPAPQTSETLKVTSEHDVAFFSKPATAALADVILSYQTPTGGWSKAVDYKQGPRQPGTHWTSQSGRGWHYSGTLDNRATTEQIRFLARVHAITEGDAYRDGALRGLRWLLKAQFPHGGWPQVYPLQPGYHEAITLNDDAMVHALEVLLDVSVAAEPYQFVDEGLRKEAAKAVDAGLECLYRAQVVINGIPTVWCAQHDPLTLEPIAARLKEPASLSGGESTAVVKFLMRQAPDSAEARRSITAALAWFEARKLTGLRRVKNAGGKTDYVSDPESDEVYWARFYDLKTQQPIFAGADDGIVYLSYQEMARRNKVAYDYFTTQPAELLSKELTRWQKRIGQQ
jgi:PelA/Pel-15E family pectate lyase